MEQDWWMDETPSRRAFLRLGATGGIIGAAGCAGAVDDLLDGEYTPGTDWPMFQFDAANTGYTPDAGPTDDVSVRWTFETAGVSGRRTWPPAVVDGTVYVGGTRLNALDAGTGNLLWQEGAGPLSPAAVDDIVVARGNPRSGGGLVALDVPSGDQLWEQYIHAFSSPTVADKTVYLRGSLDSIAVHALDLETGEEEWRYPVEFSEGTPAVVDGTVYTGDVTLAPGNPNEPRFYAIDAETGDVRWQVHLATSSSPVVADGRVFVSSGATIYALDGASGEIVWTVERNLDRGAVLYPAVADGTLYVSGADVAAYDVGDGSEVWQVDREMKGLQPTVTDDTLYVSDGSGTIHALSTESGQPRWSHTVAAPDDDSEDMRGSAPTISGGVAYVQGISGDVFALEEE